MDIKYKIKLVMIILIHFAIYIVSFQNKQNQAITLHEVIWQFRRSSDLTIMQVNNYHVDHQMSTLQGAMVVA